ncbi:transglutaminase domain-containing protein [Clostridium botulinum C/D]|nr:transglutaminase domain-containing protein [Clostridium botulinum C/D]MCD3277396.1 transglutaminase domain-containing protein [Clostridium botulinum C/D]MCD3289158.1 transglutaminase domain-containing protein [Clostridium botulinum C/D]
MKMNKKKWIGVLSIGAILGGFVSAGIPITAEAVINAYTVKVKDEIYKYDKQELINDFLNFKCGDKSILYDDFARKLKEGHGFYAFQDTEKGFVDYYDISNAFLKTKEENKSFDVEEFIKSKETKVIEVSWVKKAIVTKEGEVKYETPLNDDTNHKENENKDKQDDDKSEDVVNKDSQSSEDKTSHHKNKHSHKSSSDVAQKDKEAVEKQKQEQAQKDKEAVEKQKQGQAQKDKEAAEKQKQEQAQKDKEAAEKQEAKKIAKENNRLIEEVKNNIKLGDLTNVKNNLTLFTKGANGVKIVWKSDDESIIENDGTVIRPNADEKDRKVTLVATFMKDSVISTKEFQVIVKAQEKQSVKTEEEEIAELLKSDKKIEVKTQEKFNNVMKEAISQLKSTYTILVSEKDYSKYNFNNFQNMMIEMGGNDFGKPSISTAGGSVQVKDGKIPMTILFTYKKNIDEIKSQRQATEAAVKRIVKEVVKDDMTSVEKELALHDYVVKHADYNMEGLKKNPADLEDHSAYGVLVLGKGVCESYAKAMHLLLNEVGIECKYATGYKKNKDGSQGGGHAWNMVKLDNEWYNLDATWDDPVSDRVGRSDKDVVVSPVIHTYFNVTDDIFNKDHIRGEYEQKNYPKANGTKYSYDNLDVDEFTNDGTKVPKVTNKEELMGQVKEAMKNKKTVLYVRLKGFKMTQEELMNELGKVLDGNIYKSYGVSPTDESHAYCNFVLR